MNSLPRLESFYQADSRPIDWENIAPIFLVENVNGLPPRQATWFKTAWNDHELRLLFHAQDSDAWATLTERDAPLYNEEVVEVFLDPVGDLECYFEIEVNPLNTVCDLVLRRTQSGYRKNFAWNCEGLQTTVRTKSDAWTTEITIPFSSLMPGLPIPGRTWRANFHRIDRPKNSGCELSSWSPTNCERFHIQQKFGFLEFIR